MFEATMAGPYWLRGPSPMDAIEVTGDISCLRDAASGSICHGWVAIRNTGTVGATVLMRALWRVGHAWYERDVEPAERGWLVACVRGSRWTVGGDGLLLPLGAGETGMLSLELNVPWGPHGQINDIKLVFEIPSTKAKVERVGLDTYHSDYDSGPSAVAAPMHDQWELLETQPPTIRPPDESVPRPKGRNVKTCDAPGCESPVAGVSGVYAKFCPDCLRAGAA